MLTLILILAQFQIGSHHETVIQATDQCQSSPDVVYHVDSGWVCVPSDKIFSQGFEND